MKQLTIFLISFLIALSIHAHNNLIGGAITITVNGNKNLQILVDGKDYNLSNTDATGNKTTIYLNNLETGQHTFQVIRTDRNTNRSDRISTTFNLRYGYDMLIKVNGNGSFELIETKNTGISYSQLPMNDADFNILLKNVKNQRSTDKRNSEITNALNKTKNYFTTNQVVQLLQQVNSEDSRIELVKMSYPTITDPSNFYQLYELIKSQAGRNELEVYVNNFNEETNSNIAMSDPNFNTLFQDIRKQWPVSTQMNSLTNAFNNSSNYFTTSQAIQLIQFVTDESNRLQLAKLSYRSIVDRSNFNQMYNLLNVQSSQNELAVYVNNYKADNDTKIAMTNVSFTNLYQDIYKQWPVSTQMTSLTNAFNNTNNYFTVSQVKQLIQIISSESNRLQLAKLSYRSIVDRDNFNQLYILLESQSGKDELVAYVKYNYNAGNNPLAAMPGVSFNTLYQDIKNQWPVTTQMNSLTNAFNNTTNYFSVSQAKQLIQLIGVESNRLQMAKLSYRSIVDRNNFNQIYGLLNTQASQNELAVYINNYNAGNGISIAMSETSFNSFYEGIKNQWSTNTQMTSLTNAFNNTNNYFTASQVKQLIQIVSTESDRLQLAKLSYRSITDQVNFSQIYNLLSSQASRNELEAFVNNHYNTGSSPNVSMSDANFNTLLQTIQGQFFPFEQMNSLTNVFNNTSNYFSSSQAKQLIPLVSYESNRLHLAKLSYRSITDRSNFNQIYELLSSQSSKDELSAYVKEYKD